MNLEDQMKLRIMGLEKCCGRISIIYGTLSIQWIPYLILYALIFERRVL